jgi:twitching motility protein PilT
MANWNGWRVTVCYGCAAVFRQIPTKILSAEELALPSILTRAAMLHKGLVLVTGPTGSGKSTTLAAMIDYANKHRKDHIITVEDPIEFVHQSQGCIVNHREVGRYTPTPLARH